MRYVFCSKLIDSDINTAFVKSGVDVIHIPYHSRLDGPVSSHADMLCFKLREDFWVIERETYDKISSLIPSHVKVITDSFEQSGSIKYPYDIRFNAAAVSEFLFCREKYVSPVILENTSLKVVDVKQGYAKCSICKVNEYSFITSDISLKRAGEKCGLDVLLISQGHICIDGYNYGFIGGASGLIDNKLLFFGDITLHPDYKAIHKFIYDRNVEEICLSNRKLYDFGGVLLL
ncbi:MAG: hypothetical protein E7588_01445 [Ruminococcaceae bacterium]|nr:hypothetical protein [Oscillospiraceae bacterium]